MSLDAKLTTQLCLENVDVITPREMMNALTGYTQYLFTYLSGLYVSHPSLCDDYHDDLVLFMAQNDESEKYIL